MFTVAPLCVTVRMSRREKTARNKMPRNDARKITGRTGRTQKWTQRKRNKRAWKNSSLWNQLGSANMRKTIRERPLDERAAYAGVARVCWARMCSRDVHLRANRAMNQADSGGRAGAGIIISKEINLSPREERNGRRVIVRLREARFFYRDLKF